MGKQVSKNRYAASYQMGKESEDKFQALMISRGHTVTAATRNENIFKHIDFFVDSVGVDVKGNRHLDNIWLELDNVKGNKGWLRGEATYIVFDVVELSSFCFFKREDLLNYVLKNVTETTTTSKEFGKFYTRSYWGKKDKLVKVRYSDIEHLLTKKLAY